jgi:ribosomal protein L40E
MIQFSCPYCTAVMKFDDAFAGKTVKCLNCQHEMMAPELVEAAVPPPPPPVPDAAGQPPAATDDETLQRETVLSFVHKFLILLALVVAQQLVDFLPWMTSKIGSVTIGSWFHLILALAIVVFMLLILPPLRRLVRYYIGLVFRVRPRLAAEPELQSQISRATTYFILFIYLAIFYGAAVEPVRASGSFEGIIWIAQVTIITFGIVFLVLFILAVRPLLARASSKITDKAMAATQKLDSKPCAGCGARVPLTAKFCPSCGKPS